MRNSSRSTWVLVASVGIALLAGLVWLLVSTGAPGDGGDDETVGRGAGGGDPAPTAGPDLASAGQRVEGSTVREGAEVETVLAPDPADGSEWILSGRLVARDTDEPLPGYLILVLLAGTKPTAGPVVREHRVVTDHRGVFKVAALSRPGPWDVYAFPLDPMRVRKRAVRDARVGTGTAEQVPSRELPLYRTRAGALVVLRSPLPGGVRHEGLLVEVREPISFFSSDSRAPGGFARMHRSADGFLKARIPHVGPHEKDKGYGVRIVSEDGLWGLAKMYSGTLSDETVIEIDATLEPRAKAVLRLVVDGATGATGATGAAAPYVGWELPLGDPARDGLELPMSLTINEYHNRLIPTGPDTWEIHDLPAGPVEIRTREHVARRGGEIKYEVVGTVRANAIHGDPSPTEVRLRAKP